MNVLDVALLVILALSVFGGLWKGLVKEIFSLAGVLAGVLVAFLLSPRLAPALARWIPNQSAAYAAALVLLFVGTLIVAALLAWLITKVVELAQLGPLNRLLGGAFGVVRALVIGLFIVLGLTLFLEPSSPILARSTMVPYLSWGARLVAPLLPDEPRDVLLERLDRLPIARHRDASV